MNDLFKVKARLNFQKILISCKNAMVLATERLSVKIFLKVGLLKYLPRVAANLHSTTCFYRKVFPTPLTFT